MWVRHPLTVEEVGECNNNVIIGGRHVDAVPSNWHDELCECEEHPPNVVSGILTVTVEWAFVTTVLSRLLRHGTQFAFNAHALSEVSNH